MNFVLVHLGSYPPDYLWDCIAQIQKHSSAPIYLYTNHNHDVPKGVIKAEVSKWRAEEYEDCAGWMGQAGQFWDFAFRRMFYVEAIMERYELERCVHIENDVLIYSDPETIFFPTGMSITPIGPKYASYAYAWIPTLGEIRRVNTEALRIASEGKEVLLALYSEGMVNEMMIARELQERGLVGSLPLFAGSPEVFDGASAGQFLGGTPGQNNAGWTGSHHFLGRHIQEGRAKVFYEQGRPWLEIHGERFAYHNLHVHSKDLKRWM